MKINTNLLENDFIPKVKKGKNNLEDAYDILAGTTVPSDFSSTYRQKLKKTKTSIGNLEEDLNDLKTYASEKVDDFENAESKNNKVLEALTTVAETNANITNETTKATIEATAEATEQITDWVEDIYAEINNYIEGIVDEIGTVASEASEWVTGAVETSSKYYQAQYEANREQEQVMQEVGATVTATFTNIVFATGKGISYIAESIVDAVVFVGGVICILGGLYVDLDQYARDPSSELSFENTKACIQATMQTIGFDATGSWWDALYDTKVGEWLDDNAIGIFKSDGLGTDIVSRYRTSSWINNHSFCYRWNRINSRRRHSTKNNNRYFDIWKIITKCVE